MSDKLISNLLAILLGAFAGYLINNQLNPLHLIMSIKPISNIVAFFKGVFAGQVVNNQLNPLLLDIAIKGYCIQSHSLQIPDRFGIFSSGPPRLQVHEGLAFITLVGLVCLTLVLDAFNVFVCRLYGQPNCRKLGAVFPPLILVPGFVLFWIAAVNDRRRKPGYEWADWKLRKD